MNENLFSGVLTFNELKDKLKTHIDGLGRTTFQLKSAQKDDDGGTTILGRYFDPETMLKLCMVRLLGTRSTQDAGNKREMDFSGMWMPLKGFLFHYKRKKYMTEMRETKKVHQPANNEILFMLDAATAFSPYKINIKGTKCRVKLYSVVARLPWDYYSALCLKHEINGISYDREKKYYEFAHQACRTGHIWTNPGLR